MTSFQSYFKNFPSFIQKEEKLFYDVDWSVNSDGKGPWWTATVDTNKTNFILIICGRTGITILFNPKNGDIIKHKNAIMNHRGITWSKFNDASLITRDGTTITVHNGPVANTIQLIRLNQGKPDVWGILDKPTPFCKYVKRTGIFNTVLIEYPTITIYPVMTIYPIALYDCPSYTLLLP